jgi:hypothetical protein
VVKYYNYIKTDSKRKQNGPEKEVSENQMIQQKLSMTKEKPSRNIFLHAQYKIKYNANKKEP